MAKRKQSTAELIGISNFSRNGLQTKSQGEIVYFLVQPTNISVLSEQSVAIKIQHLMQLLLTSLPLSLNHQPCTLLL